MLGIPHQVRNEELFVRQDAGKQPCGRPIRRMLKKNIVETRRALSLFRQGGMDTYVAQLKPVPCPPTPPQPKQILPLPLVSLPLNKYGKVAVDFCSDRGGMMEHFVETRHVLMAPWRCLVSTTEEQRRYGQKDQDLVCNGFSGNDTKADPVGFCFYPD